MTRAIGTTGGVLRGIELVLLDRLVVRGLQLMSMRERETRMLLTPDHAPELTLVQDRATFQVTLDRERRLLHLCATVATTAQDRAPNDPTFDRDAFACARVRRRDREEEILLEVDQLGEREHQLASNERRAVVNE